MGFCTKILFIWAQKIPAESCKNAKAAVLNYRYKLNIQCSQTSLIRTPEGHSEVSVLERCPYWRGHYDDVIFNSLLTV